MLEDLSGVRVSRGKVEEAVINYISMSLSLHEILSSLVGRMSDEELVEWATGDEGNWIWIEPEEGYE